MMCGSETTTPKRWSSDLLAIVNLVRSLVRLFRVHHWVKNSLVLLPAIAAHRIFELEIFLSSLKALCTFCLCSSGVYVLNDCLDRQSDQTHPLKKSRPIASGEISASVGWGLGVGLILTGLFLTLLVSPPAAIWLFAYCLANLGYSVALKKLVVADVMLLTSFYLFRLLVGSAASGIPLSPWLMAFCFAISLSLACCKRYAELLTYSDGVSLHERGRGYLRSDAATIHIMGVSSAFASVIVLSLYLDSPTASNLYRCPYLLWACCPFVLYWLLRIWILTGRGVLVDDPVTVALKDWHAWFVGFISLLIFWLASSGI